jgi:pimeloyl-ACP methyl ester carboxylesterase
MDAPWGPPPLEVATELFFQGCDADEAARYHAMLCPESPQCVFDVTRGWLVPVDNTLVGCPVLVLAGSEDRLGSIDGFRRTATYYGGEYRFYRGRGHNLMLDQRWEDTARQVDSWLGRHFGTAVYA